MTLAILSNETMDVCGLNSMPVGLQDHLGKKEACCELFQSDGTLPVRESCHIQAGAPAAGRVLLTTRDCNTLRATRVALDQARPAMWQGPRDVDGPESFSLRKIADVERVGTYSVPITVQDKVIQLWFERGKFTMRLII